MSVDICTLYVRKNIQERHKEENELQAYVWYKVVAMGNKDN
jgi:hypothetical protein